MLLVESLPVKPKRARKTRPVPSRLVEGDQGNNVRKGYIGQPNV